MSNEQLCLNDFVLASIVIGVQIDHLNELLDGQAKMKGKSRYGVTVGQLPMNLVKDFTIERDGLVRYRAYLVKKIEEAKARQAANNRVTEEVTS